MRLTRRHRWMVTAGVASAVAAPLAERAVEAVWRRAAGEEPPADVGGRDDVHWGWALAWAASSALAVALAKVAARRGAGLAWERVTGTRPPASVGRRTRRRRR